MYVPRRLFATFTPAADGAVADSGFAFVGQSGALGGYLLAAARSSGLGMTAWATVGNQADCTCSEVATALLTRPEVNVLALYLESIADPAELITMAQTAHELQKSVALLIGGQSLPGWRAALSHTGALVRPDSAFALTAERLGVVLVEDLDELHDASYALLKHTRGVGSQIGALSTSGGAGSLVADHVDRAGLAIADTSAELKSELAAYIPSFGSLENPVDVTPQLFAGTGEEFASVVRVMALAPDFDQLIVVVTQLGGERGITFANAVVGIVGDTDKPLHVCWLADAEFSKTGRQILSRASVPVYGSIHTAVAAAKWLAADAPGPVAAWDGRADSRFAGLPESVSQAQATDLLAAAHVPQPAAQLVTNVSDAPNAVAAVGGRAVLKLQSPDAIHKTDLGLLRLNVTELDATVVAAELLDMGDRAATEGILVQEQVASGFELLIGISRRTAGIPPLLTIGMGGVTAEVWDDVVSLPLPVTREEVAAMITSLRCSKLLAGYRGGPGYDVAAAIDAVLKLIGAAEMVSDRLIELEVNPLIVHEQGAGCHAADVLLRLLPKAA
jgi:acyl-CoA synthetase (NDP forming)